MICVSRSCPSSASASAASLGRARLSKPRVFSRAFSPPFESPRRCVFAEQFSLRISSAVARALGGVRELVANARIASNTAARAASAASLESVESVESSPSPRAGGDAARREAHAPRRVREGAGVDGARSVAGGGGERLRCVARGGYERGDDVEKPPTRLARVACALLEAEHGMRGRAERRESTRGAVRRGGEEGVERTTGAVRLGFRGNGGGFERRQRVVAERRPRVPRGGDQREARQRGARGLEERGCVLSFRRRNLRGERGEALLGVGERGETRRKRRLRRERSAETFRARFVFFSFVFSFRKQPLERVRRRLERRVAREGEDVRRKHAA